MIAGTDPDNDGVVGNISEVLAGYPDYDELDILVANGNFTDIDLDLKLQLPVNQLSDSNGSSGASDMLTRPQACERKTAKVASQLPLNQKCAQRIIGKAVLD